MKRSYSTYDAKARFSELIRTVRSGKSVRITYHGQPIAEVVPLAPPSGTLADRLADLESRGVIVPASRPAGLRPLATRKGALQRFLKDRD
ncbi:MAG: type II toxin-antitoxin system Phd/YefM family antitoxin [Thermoanaerobaculia bacterium]